MTKLYAQPYDISACGFYFDSAEEYREKAATLRNSYGQPVEEFEIQFIDGEAIDGCLFNALAVNQMTVADWFEAVEEWDQDDKLRVIIAVGEAGYSFDLGRDRPDRLDVDIYAHDTMREFAVQMVDDGIFGAIPASIQNYIDYDAISRDLEMDYGQVTIDGARYIYRGDVPGRGVTG